MRILIVEDDKKLSDAMAAYLMKNHFEIDAAYDGETGYLYAIKNIYNVIILDRMLPACDGLTMLKQIRSHNILTPVIMVTALNQLSDRIEGFQNGTDDYLAKPFAMIELLARIHSLLRRNPEINSPSFLTYGDLKFYSNEKKILCNSTTCILAKKEALLFEMFILNKEQTLTREQIIDHIWGPESAVSSANLDNYISFLRRRLKNVESHCVITTVHGVGFRLEEAVERNDGRNA